MWDVPEDISGEFWGYWQENIRLGWPGFDSVEDFLNHWVYDGAAYPACVGDFTIFMTVVAYVFAEWGNEKARCKTEADWKLPIPWSVNRAFKGHPENSSMGVGTQIFNPLYFKYHRPD